MVDALVATLNRAGFQPIFLPQTGLAPPEMYNLTSKDHRPRLARRGPLGHYLQPGTEFTIVRSSLADISQQRSTGKSLSASADFLSKCLACLGIAAPPKLDLSFAKTSKLAFAFRGVFSLRVDPAEIDHALKGLDLGAIPDEYVERGFLHIAYEYAFATAVVMQREDGHDFSVRTDADVASFITIGAGVSLRMANSSTVSFETAEGAELPAFAYRAGRLTRDSRWRFYPEETYRSDQSADAQPYILRRGIVLDAETAD
jgi:hypothetical protein